MEKVSIRDMLGVFSQKITTLRGKISQFCAGGGVPGFWNRFNSLKVDSTKVHPA